MHEQGIAASVIGTLLARDVRDARVRLHVSGGRTDSAAFDAALRAHLEADPRLTLELEIVHAPADFVCAWCAAPFVTSTQDTECPGCGGPPLPAAADEQLEIELLDVGEA